MARYYWLRPRIGLRTLFVILTLTCVWLGYNASIVRARKAMIRQVHREGWNFGFLSPPNMELPKLSLIRRSLGDSYLLQISYPANAPPERIAAFQRVFPETNVWRNTIQWHGTPAGEDAWPNTQAAASR